MEPHRQAAVDDEPVRTHASGRRFWVVLAVPWLVAVWLGVVASALFGFGLAIGVASGLAVALGISFVWVVMVFAVDDGDVDDRVRESLERAEGRGSGVEGP